MTFLVDQYGQGLHPDVPGEDYYRRTLGEANKGALDVVNRSLYHYRAWVDEDRDEEKERETFTFGRAFHCALLEPERYKRDWMVLPSFGTLQSSKNRASRDAYLDIHADKEFVSREQANRVTRMVQAVQQHELAGALIYNGLTELTATWRDEETGLPCKARLDHYNAEKRYALDPKTCDDGSPEGFARSVHRYRYHVQNAHYCEGMRACGSPLDHFIFLCIEKEPPHAVALYKLDAPGEERGYELRRRDMAAMATGVRTNRWPSYNDEKTAELRLPAFAFYDLKD